MSANHIPNLIFKRLYSPIYFFNLLSSCCIVLMYSQKY